MVGCEASLEFILSKQKWPNGQRQKKFGAAGRLAGEPGTFVDVQSLWELLDKALH